MISIPVVSTCPYTMVGKGVAKIAHPVLATLAGAVYDKIEWMAFLIGTRDTDGLGVSIHSLRVPQQYRDESMCRLAREEQLPKDVVGVVHSHHSMLVRFSAIDYHTLNPRFPLSIVVGQLSVTPSQEEGLLGFDYRAEGRAQLPCSSVGVIPFTIAPDPPLKEWPGSTVPGFDTPTSTSLEGCPIAKRERKGIMLSCVAPCGITSSEVGRAIFGRDATIFLREVEANTEKWNRPRDHFPVKDHRRQHVYQPGNNSSDFLDRWGWAGD